MTHGRFTLKIFTKDESQRDETVSVDVISFSVLDCGDKNCEI